VTVTPSRLAQRVVDSVLILSIREAFISLLPYLVVVATSLLILGAVDVLSLLRPESALYRSLRLAHQVTQLLFPLATVIAVGYHLSKNVGVDAAAGILLAVSAFLVSSGYLVQADAGILLDIQGGAAYAIAIPVLSTYLLSRLARLRVLSVAESRVVSVFLTRHVNLILPFLVAFATVVGLTHGVSELGGRILPAAASATEPGSVAGLLLRWQTLGHLLWLLGVHGSNVAGSILGAGFMLEEILPGINAREFANSFLFLGGGGAVWGCAIAVLLVSKDAHLKQIARLALPFHVFNMSELLMYGLPIVLNPYFIVPFVACPLVNFLVAYVAIDLGMVTVAEVSVSWMTPVLVSGYFVGGIAGALLQVALVAGNVLIYAPFVRMYARASSGQVMLERLSRRLAVSTEIEGQAERQHISEQGRRLEANQELRQAIDQITAGELQLYYQPKVDAHRRCRGFEALLRLAQPDGRVLPPHFLGSLEAAGFSDVIDWWVVERTLGDLDRWKLDGFEPRVSINLSRALLTEEGSVGKLIEKTARHHGRIEIEILETTYIRELSRMRGNIDRLKANGIHTAIDDFGTGFSSLSLLYQLNATTIKLDKSILDNTDSDKGRVLYQELCRLCKGLGFTLVAEGVETEKRAELVIGAGVDLMQGALYSLAVPADEARRFAMEHSG